MKFEIWNKQKISELSEHEKKLWFDVLNYKLEEDRDISLEDPDYEQLVAKIKTDYYEYIESCPLADNFYKYYILRDNDKIVSVARVNINENKYLLEGLQTHHEYYQKGYASQVIDGLVKDLYHDGILILHSEARTWNTASNALQKKLGFILYAKEGHNFLYQLDIPAYIKKQQERNEYVYI